MKGCRHAPCLVRLGYCACCSGCSLWRECRDDAHCRRDGTDDSSNNGGHDGGDDGSNDKSGGATDNRADNNCDNRAAHKPLSDGDTDHEPIRITESVPVAYTVPVAHAVTIANTVPVAKRVGNDQPRLD